MSSCLSVEERGVMMLCDMARRAIVFVSKGLCCKRRKEVSSRFHNHEPDASPVSRHPSGGGGGLKGTKDARLKSTGTLIGFALLGLNNVPGREHSTTVV